MTLRIAWFASARGTGSRLLLEETLAAIQGERLDAEVVCVFCNRERKQSENTKAFLTYVKKREIPVIEQGSLAWRKRVHGEISDPRRQLAAWRRDFDEAAMRRIEEHRPDVAVMAGYMLVVTEELFNKLPMLNLHPALPDGPIGTWQEVIRELIKRRASKSGMTLQRITEKLDRGPAFSICCYPLPDEQFESLRAQDDVHSEDSELFRAIRAEGVKRESVFLVESLKKIAEDPKLLEPNAMSDPFDLTKPVDKELSPRGGREREAREREAREAEAREREAREREACEREAREREAREREAREREAREREARVTGEPSAVPGQEPVGDPKQGEVAVAAGQVSWG